MQDNNVLKKNKHFAISMILNLIEGLLSGCNFIAIYAAIQLLWLNNITPSSLIKITSLVAAIFILRLFIYCTGYTEGQIGGSRVSKNIRIFLGNKLAKIPLSNFTKTKSGTYINNATSDVSNYETVLTHKIGDILKNSALIIMVIIFMSTKLLISGLVLLTAFLLLIPTLALSFMFVNIYGKKKNNIYVENVSSITEYITGIQVMRSYGFGGKKNKTVTNAMKDYSDISFVYELAVIPIGVGYNILQWLTLPFVIYFSGNAWLSGTLPVTDFVVLSMIPLFICKLNGTLFVDLTSYKNLLISKKRILEIINEKDDISNGNSFLPQNHEIQFQNVSFSYEKDEPILNTINFKAKDKKLTAIVGPSGSGKSTILNVLTRYYTPQSGKIMIGGLPIQSSSMESVLSHISLVDQDVFLFNDTIKNNIRYAKQTASDEEIINACRLANCHDFISHMPNGYDSQIGENGNCLSGGERQRLSIARAILKDSPIVLLDEATASLDIENELLVKKAISNLLNKNRTVIMIAHTLSVIKNADSIIVVEDGTVIEQGSHKELLALRGKYYTMWNAEQELIA